jgi:hypothetical protein
MKALYAALLQAQRFVSGVEKDSENAFQKYKYASTEDMLQEARECLLKAGLTCFCEHWYILDGNVVSMMTLVHAESGESKSTTIAMPLVEEKGRPRDKAVTTALTYSLGYFMRGLLLIPRVEKGTDVDNRDDRTLTAAVNGMNERELREVHAALKKRMAVLKPPDVQLPEGNVAGKIRRWPTKKRGRK